MGIRVAVLALGLAALAPAGAAADSRDATAAGVGTGRSAGAVEAGGGCGHPVHAGEIPVAGVGPVPVGTGVCGGVRPGGAVLTDVGRCTLNFVFRAPDGERFVGTAGHCVLAAAGDAPVETVWPVGSGPVARDEFGSRVGEVAYAVYERPRDFALIRVDDGVGTDPEMCHFGGPDGIDEALSGEPRVLRYWGSGMVVGTVVPARSAVAPALPDPDRVAAFGVALPGDSGAGVIDAAGRAIGVVVTAGVQLQPRLDQGVGAGTVGITRIGPQLRRAQERLGVTLMLETAPVRTGSAAVGPEGGEGG